MTLPSFDIDQLLSGALQTVGGSAVWAPPSNTYEDDQGFWVQVGLPGMDRKDIQITLEDSVLSVKGERKDETPEHRRYFMRELGAGTFSRSFRLPSNVDPAKVSASHKEGVLTIALPKREEAKPRQITVG